MKDRASIRPENVFPIDRWEDEGGAGESPAKNSDTPPDAITAMSACLHRQEEPSHPEPSCARGDLRPFASRLIPDQIVLSADKYLTL